MSRIRSTGSGQAAALLLTLVTTWSAIAQPISTPPPSSSAPGGSGLNIRDLLGNGGGGSGGGGAGAGAAASGGTCSAPTAGATCGGAGPASQGNTSGVNLGAGNPINLTHGNKFQTEVDLPALPGELGLEIVRHYNSSARHVVGQLGMGWRLSYETDLYLVGATVQILQADGARLMFNIDPSRPSLCTSQNPAQGWIEIRPAASGASKDKEYIWHWTHGPEAGRRLSFNAQGKLVQIVSASGAVLSITRGPRGELLQVTDPQGRRLILQHASAEQRQAATEAHPVFAGIQHIDSPVGRFSYTHGSGQAQTGNLVRVSLPTQVEDTRRAHDWSNRRASTSSISRLYHYEDPRHPQALTGISVLGTGSDGQTLDQRLATYRYDERARAVFSARAAVDEPRSGSSGSSGNSSPGTNPSSNPGSTAAIEQVQLKFLQTTTPTREGQTLLTNSLGQQTLYTHRIIGGEYRLTEALGAGCAACGPVNLRWRYDDLGRLVEMVQLTSTTIQDGQAQAIPIPQAALRHTLDAQGRTVRIEHITYVNGRPQTPELVERHEYTDPRWPDKPTLLGRPSVLGGGREQQKQLSYNDAGQLVQLKETGWSPLDAQGQLASSLAQATALERSTAYTYTRINGRSLLTQVDGPLPNGPSASPADSDISAYGWDPRGSFLTTVTLPGGLSSQIANDIHTGLISRVVNDANFATTFQHDARLNLTQISSQGPGWAQPQVRRFTYDAMGRVIETHAGPEGSPGTAETLNAYDGAGRLLWRASAKGELQQWRHDSEGNVQAMGRHSNRMSLEWNPSQHVTSDNKDVPVPRSANRSTLVAKPRLRQWLDDFGRTVRSDSADSGTTLRRFDQADRLIGMTDANGNAADYQYDVQARIVLQTITDTSTAAHPRAGDPPAKTTTEWRYNKRQLLEVIHPSQRERFEYDARGLRSARTVTLVTPGGEHVALTRYEHDVAGQLTATSLPDGTRLIYARNGQQQVVGLSRQRVHTPWLRWLEAEQDIAHGFERNLVGVQQYTAGNGMQSQWQRSHNGALARVVTRHASNPGPVLLSASTQESIERLLGIRSAHASVPASKSAVDASDSSPPPEPGALALPVDPQAVIDHRYLWSPQGLLLLDRQRGGKPADHSQTHHAYNRRGQLIASVDATATATATAAQWQEDAVWRFAYDAHQRRTLSQQNAASQADTGSQTRTSHFVATSSRLADGARYDAAGRPERLGEREHVWDALGRLTEVRGRSESNAQASSIANYRYDHRGLRNTKTVGETTTHYLHDESRQPLAELDAQGRIQRQYVYLADLPIAVIDSPARLADDEGNTASVLDDLGIAFGSWVNKTQDITWLHTNHLGAPEAASNAQGELIWRARYAPFGAAEVRGEHDFALNLRLPGQVYDAETGLHYNRQRYYDPALGQYLTPDPLGNPDGPNPYAYVAFNPLGFVDPDGLLLFAFDGTDNSNQRPELARLGGAPTNVELFREAYLDGQRNYVSGVGTRHIEDGRLNYLMVAYSDILPRGFGPVPDRGGNITGRERIDRMWNYLIDAAEETDNEEVIQIDIVGFSRGAAQARDFANRVAAAHTMRNGVSIIQYQAIDRATGQQVSRCQRVNLRFMGLFDTVLSVDLGRGPGYRLGIPAAFEHVAQAVALNEYRSQPLSWDVLGYPLNSGFWHDTRRHLPESLHYGGFPLESIGASSSAPGQVRIERGFIGAHADIGGGYRDDNRLSLVAYSWMVAQARAAGVNMNSPAALESSGAVAMHDQSNALRIGDPRTSPIVDVSMVESEGQQVTVQRQLNAEDRQVRGAVSGTTQRTMGFGEGIPTNRSLTNIETHAHITYTPRIQGSYDGVNSNITGTVNMQSYLQWLRNAGYCFADDACDDLPIQ